MKARENFEFSEKSKFQSCSTIGMWGVYPEVLRAHAQKSPFFSYLVLTILEKSLKNCWKITNLKIAVLKVVFETFLQNGRYKIGKKGDFWACALNTTG